MTTESEHFVPKVHPLSRPIEADDPFTLNAAAVEGDPEVMLECLVQEYAWMGWNTEQVFGLFRDPGYPALNALLNFYGEDGIRRRIENVLKRVGVFRVSGAVIDGPEEKEESELIQLGVARALIVKGDRHAQSV